jgi:type IV pilus assembly protein PilE
MIKPYLQAGLTLIELMLVLAIVAILAGVAIPLYNDQIQRSRRADAMAALTTVALAQERFYTANGTYAGALADLPVDAALQEGNSKHGFYTLAIANPDGAQSFSITATATGAQASDTSCTTFTLNQLGARAALNADGVANDGCW